MTDGAFNKLEECMSEGDFAVMLEEYKGVLTCLMTDRKRMIVGTSEGTIFAAPAELIRDHYRKPLDAPVYTPLTFTVIDLGENYFGQGYDSPTHTLYLQEFFDPESRMIVECAVFAGTWFVRANFGTG